MDRIKHTNDTHVRKVRFASPRSLSDGRERVKEGTMDRIIRLPRRRNPFPTEKRSEVRIRETSQPQVTANVSINDIQGWDDLPVINLSQHGALIEVPHPKAPLFYHHQKVLVELRSGKERVSLGGIVQHRDGNRVGIFFSEFSVKLGSDASSIISRMVYALERKHLRRRALSSPE